MPSQYGGVKRVNIVRDSSSLRRNLNLYVISEAADGTLVSSNTAIKENLKQWLSQGKMISDTIDVLDTKNCLILGLNLQQLPLWTRTSLMFWVTQFHN